MDRDLISFGSHSSAGHTVYQITRSSGLKQHTFISYSFGSPKQVSGAETTGPAGSVPSGSSWENPFRPLLEAANIPGLLAAPLQSLSLWSHCRLLSVDPSASQLSCNGIGHLDNPPGSSSISRIISHLEVLNLIPSAVTSAISGDTFTGCRD